MNVFPGLLWSFQHVESCSPADKALVVRDADEEEPAEVEKAMRAQVQGRQYPFRLGIDFHATRRETETWLLADVEAINRVAHAYGGTRVGAIRGPIENIPDAKERFVGLLTQAGLPYVPGIVREITRQIELDVLRRECPSFRLLEGKAKAR